MKRLFLDDERNPIDCASYMYLRADCRIYHEEWDIVRSYKQFVDYINSNGLPEFISYDHDLADNFKLREELDIEDWFDFENDKEYTGKDCANWLVNYCMDNNVKLPDYVVHSMNPTGRENIEGLLKEFKKFQENEK